ncbi:uncharacterized protein LOC117124397 isoform X2 [Anneissia japonica]|nr:uncharacterized protein LOC117124397 isoform X2 [Anneissia japonica]
MIPSSIFVNRFPVRCEDLGDGRLLLESQQRTEEIETYFNNELEKWLNTQVDGVDQDSCVYCDAKKTFSISQCVIVTGFVEHESQERTRDKLQIILQRQIYGGGDVEYILYPFGNAIGTAVAIFCERSVASYLILTKKISYNGHNLQIYPFKVCHQMKTFILQLDKEVIQLEPTLKDHIFSALDVKGRFLKDGRKLMLKEDDDVFKVYKYVSDRIKGLLNSYSGWFGKTERKKEELKEEGQTCMILPVENALCKWFDDDKCFKIAVCGLKNQVHVNFKIGMEDSEIQLEGNKSQVRAVSKDVQTVLMEIREQESILNEVKWYREEKDCLKLFEDNAIVNLEKHHRKGIGFTMEIPQPQKVLSFDINFQKMTATQLDTKEVVNVVRWEIKELKKLPDYWEPMKAGGKLVVPVNPDSKEYTYIGTAFQESLAKGGIHAQCAIKIFRIQNHELWKQFAAKKEAIENTMPGRNVERLLYHGTGEDTVVSINKDGFNRSYAGKNGNTNNFIR